MEGKQTMAAALTRMLRGSLRVPSDKSLSHRAVLFSALADGTSHLSNVLPSDDVKSSLAAVADLGASVEMSEGDYGLDCVIEGWGDAPDRSKLHDLDCGNSGTTTRLLMGLLAGLGIEARLHGDASLSSRPMGRVIEPLQLMGASIEAEEGHLPAFIHPARNLHGIEYRTKVASAQVKSAILLAGLAAKGKTIVEEPAKSRDHTERLLPAFGVPVERTGLEASLEGPARLHAHDLSIPGDPSSAAFPAVAAALVPSSDVLLQDVALNPTRSGAFAVMQRMGVDISFENEHAEGAESIGTIRVRYTPELAGVEVTGEELPSLIDEVPVLAVLAAHARGETVFCQAGELRVKESDRFVAIIDGLAAFGIHAWEDGDDLHIGGEGQGAFERSPREISLPTYHDHRMAMTWSIAELVAGNTVELDDRACVSVSWPSFYEDMKSLRVE